MTSLSISTVIPTYNRCHLITRAVESALAQSLANDEVIVVDDGSTDDTESVLAPYRDRIRYVKKANAGAGAARNRGISESRCDLVAFLDSDDEWMPGKLELQRNLLAARSDVLFCFSNFSVKDEDGRVHENYLERWHEQLGHGDGAESKDRSLLREHLDEKLAYSSIADLGPTQSDFQIFIGDLSVAEVVSSSVLTSSVVARRIAAGAALRFAVDVGTWEDWECFGRLSLEGKAAFLDLCTVFQHAHAGDRLTGVDPLVFADARFKIFERVWGADPAFLAKHAAFYQDQSQSARCELIRELLAEGRTRRARALLPDLTDAPLLWRVLGWIPELPMRGAMKLRQALRSSS